MRQALRRRQEGFPDLGQRGRRQGHAVRLFSIIRTAMINGLDPYRCLEYALENVGRKPIEAILPYSKDLEIR